MGNSNFFAALCMCKNEVKVLQVLIWGYQMSRWIHKYRIHGQWGRIVFIQNLKFKGMWNYKNYTIRNRKVKLQLYFFLSVMKVFIYEFIIFRDIWHCIRIKDIKVVFFTHSITLKTHKFWTILIMSYLPKWHQLPV